MTDEAQPQGMELLELIDRLEQLLLRSELDELEVEAAGIGLLLRSPSAVAAMMPAGGPSAAAGGGVAQAAEPEPESARSHAVLAPLTGLFYTAPSPGAEPYVREGAEIHVGQVIGLIEAMKLFNEIKSDIAGRVVRYCVETGALVKAKQPLIEVEP
ncbi:MAG TPA: acetyl-CoA carboxylase [Candidatus Limnocylindria bacterium]|nr:acetyl-CoA carboxylase [Candidatus Limnocylindria bacterium]